MEFECRTCLKISNNLLDLFSTDLPIQIAVISSVEIVKKEKFPSKICEECAKNVRLLYDFRRTIVKSNEVLEDRSSKGEEANVIIKSEVQNEVVQGETKILPECEKIEGGRVYNCSWCDFSSNSYKSQFNHYRSVHTEVSKVICDVCGLLVRKDNMKRHKMVHLDSPVSCNICNKVCKNKEILRHHVRRHSTAEFLCTECGKIFANRTSYYNHKKRHKLGDARTEKCSMCPKRFYDKRTLAVHIRTHTGERPYPCQYCKKGFSSSNALKTHIRQHTNEKPYVCNLCSTAFPQKVSLTTHIKAKHSSLVLPVLQKETKK